MTVTAKRRLRISFLVLVALLLALLWLNLAIGSVETAPGTVLRVPFGGETAGTAGRIVRTIRLPRLLAAALLGGALAVAGFQLQTFFHNPIAGPFVLGISSGSKLTVALVMIGCLRAGRELPPWGMILAAFAGAMLAMGMVLAVDSRVRNMARLVICGVMIGYICSAVTDFAVTFADDSGIVNLHYWSRGSFSGIGWGQVRVIAPVVGAGLLLSMLLAKPMSAYQLGEVYAKNLGVPVKRFRTELILLSSLLAACVTAFAGPISFVGIAAPHLMRRLLGTQKPLVLLPACFLGGAAFCLLCDLLARTVLSPTELSISTVTAVFGAPVVISTMLRQRREEV